MKRRYRTAVSLLASLHLCLACDGTEVGNGVRQPAPDKTAASKTSPAAAENADMPESASASSLTDWLLATCASPFAETKAGATYASTTGETLAVKSDGKVSIGAIDHLVTPGPTSTEPYAISVIPARTAMSCTSFTNLIQADGTVERSVVLNLSMNLRWYVRAGTVETIEIKDLYTSELTTFKKTN